MFPRLIKTSVRLFHATPNNKRKIGLSLVGFPGSGKGTQTAFMTKDFDTKGISTGDLLRSIAKTDKSSFGDNVRKQMQSGGLVSDDVMLEIVKRAIESDQSKGWLLDGYPRTLNQAIQLDKHLDSVGQHLDLVFYLKLSKETIIERIQDRLVHPASGRIYNLSYKPPKVAGKDDITGEPLVRRSDDEEATVLARLKTFSEMTEPLLKHYDNSKRLIVVEAKTSDEGYNRIIKGQLQNLFGKH